MLRRALAPEHDLDSFVASFRSAERPRFFFDPRDAGAVVRQLEGSVPTWRERTLADADLVARRVVRLLGVDRVDLAPRTTSGESTRAASLPWHEDVLRGYRWDPTTFYRQVPIPEGRADIKVPWELSRCQHFPTLGMAYRATGDARYSGEVVAQIDDWIRSNPPGYGVNWACAMDVAIRAVNWLWAYHLVADADQLSDEVLARLLASLLAHGRHISRNIERYRGGITTNHTLADYVGLLYLGLLMPEFRDAAGWAEAGIAGVCECMESQVAADGVDFENSIAYHRLVLEMLAGSYLLARRNGRAFPVAYRDALHRMFEFVYHYTRPDGLAPLIGDSDDGRLQILSRYFDWEPRDHRYLLAVGAVIFERDDFASLARDAPGSIEEVAWLLGREGSRWLLDRPGDPGTRGSRDFPDSGRYVMRHGGHHAVICADEVGTAGLGNHKHNDILGYELSVSGVAMVVDPGSFVYTSDPTLRDEFRSTRAHSTLMVDGEEQNEMTGSFDLRSDAQVRLNVWSPGGNADVLDAEHTGYERLSQPVTHRRTIALGRESFAWVVIDTLLGRGEHSIESFVHLAPEGELRSAAPALEGLRERIGPALALVDGLHEQTLEAKDEAAVAYARSGVSIVVVPLNLSSAKVIDGWYAPRYGQRVPAPVIRLFGRVPCGAGFGYLVLSR